MTKRYTAADFANARFAEHPDGRVAARFGYPSTRPWESSNSSHSDSTMAERGWVPVPTKPTITRKSYDEAVEFLGGERDKYAFDYAFRVLGIEIPAPEPTDEELLAGIIRGIDDWQSITSPELLAKYLNTAGVTPPNVKGN